MIKAVLVEDELKGTIGKALGKQSEKILLQVRLMSTEYQNYLTLLEQIKQTIGSMDSTHYLRLIAPTHYLYCSSLTLPMVSCNST